MYINRIRGSNIFSYKSFDIELNKFNVIIGPNASGKTNFVKIFQFISDIASEGLSNAISIHGDIGYLRNINIADKQDIRIEFEMEEELENIMMLFKFHKNNDNIIGISIRNFYYSLSLYNDSKENWKIREEMMKATLKIYDIKEITESLNKGLKGKAVVKYEKNEFTYQILEEIPKEVEEFLDYSFKSRYVEQIENNKSILEVDQIPSIFETIRKNIKEIFIFKLNIDSIKIWKNRYGKAEIDHNGQNLLLVLEKILTDKEKREDFLLLIKDLLPFVKDFAVEKDTEDEIELYFKETYIRNKKKIPVYLLSDGTIDITAFIILTFFDLRKMIILEEPFSNIHPYLISKLINMMKNANKQIIITTHNPEILKYSGIQELLLIKRDKNGFSNISKPYEKDEIKVFLKNNLGIEDLFTENLL